jgi:activator of HSP90 ATPase
MSPDLSRRQFSLTLASFVAATSVARPMWVASHNQATEDVTKNSEAIHQELVVAASPARVYAALIDAEEFTKVTALSSMKNAAPAQIAREVGGPFSVFSGHIVGRQIELLPGQRIVQAWRVVDWPAGVYSIASFALSDRNGKTSLVFAHTGFPNGLGEHLAQGWRMNYWEPLKKYLA